jgi:hypothetical protein
MANEKRKINQSMHKARTRKSYNLQLYKHTRLMGNIAHPINCKTLNPKSWALPCIPSSPYHGCCCKQTSVYTIWWHLNICIFNCQPEPLRLLRICQKNFSLHSYVKWNFDPLPQHNPHLYSQGVNKLYRFMFINLINSTLVLHKKKLLLIFSHSFVKLLGLMKEQPTSQWYWFAQIWIYMLPNEWWHPCTIRKIILQFSLCFWPL